MILVDAHLHYWRVARGDYGWLEDAPAALRRDFLPTDLLPQLNAAGIQGSVLVQAAPTETETRFLLELAHADSSILGVVGWVDFEAPDVRARIRALVRDGGGRLLGLRPMAQDIPDPEWLARPTLDAAFDCLQEFDLAFDALVHPQQMAALHRRLEREKNLRAVLDHAGKPDIAHGHFNAWATHVERLAGQPNLHCKFSGLFAQLAPGMPEGAIDRYVGHLFACFGPNRLLWGSDWPVLTTHGDYGHWLTLARKLARQFAPEAAAHVFGRNAMAFYRRPFDISHPDSEGAGA